MTDGDDIFARWSRRKRLVAEEAAGINDDKPPPTPLQDAEVAAETDEPALLAKLGLPLPESLKAGDDFSAFMQAGVPAFLRQRALRVLWRSNPVLANLDGLNDYDADFTSPELTKKILSTGYKIGRGFLSDSDDSEILQDNSKEQQISTAVEVKEPDQNTAVSGALSESDEGSTEPVDRIEKSFHPKRMRFET